MTLPYPTNAGKTCIYERIFEKKKPWELMKSSATKGINYRNCQISSMAQPTIWDLGGQEEYLKTYHGELKQKVFKNADVLLYIVDLIDIDRYEPSEEELRWTVETILQYRKDVQIYVLLHKIDLVSNKEEVVNYVKILLTKNISHELRFFSTSIIDESLFFVWSEIIREISPKSTFINSILKEFKIKENISDVLLIEKSTGLTCGSTMSKDDKESIIIGMISLLTVTIDRFTRELQLNNINRLSIDSDEYGFILSNVNKDLLLVILLKKNVSDIEFSNLIQIKKTGDEVCEQVRKIMNE